MSFVTMGDLMDLLEDLVKSVWPTELQSFRRITYREAMTLYGTDKPDLRYDLLIEGAQDLLPKVAEGLPDGHVVKAVRLPQGTELVKNKQLQEWRKAAQQFGLKGMCKAPAIAIRVGQDMELIASSFTIRNQATYERLALNLFLQVSRKSSYVKTGP